MPTQFTNGLPIRVSVRQAKIYREALLTAEQLDDVSKGICQAGALYLDEQPVDGDSITITDTVTTEVYTFASLVTSPLSEVLIGSTVDETMLNLALAIESYSTVWRSKRVSALDSINDGSGSSSEGFVVIVWREEPAEPVLDRIYASFATPADLQHVDFYARNDYTYAVSTTVGSADPGQRTFGISRLTADLVPNERHVVGAEDQTWLWDVDAQKWILASGEGVVLVTRQYTAGVAVRDVVYQSASNTVDRASASAVSTARPLGIVRRLDEPDPGFCEVQIGGDLDGFAGLTPGKVYILSKQAGQILAEDDTGNPNYPSASGEVIQEIGVANTSSSLLVQALRDFEEI